MSQIQQFYAGQTIFITGGTGFLGKILIEKLLRSCPDLKTVYLLIRGKKGKSTSERINSLLVDPVFDVLRTEYSDFSRKIVGVNGEIAEEDLGLSDEDYAHLGGEVSVIFHLAATIRFNENLDKAVALYVNSVRCIVDFAKACKNLKAAIYVSTAYSNCVRKMIGEKLYPPPFSYEEVNQILKDAGGKKSLEDEPLNFTEGILGEWPNTYTFTKAIAEGVVAEFAKDLPFAVFRPSIVISSYREPVPGWHYGQTGLLGLICAGGLGILHVSLVDTSAKGDVVPVDYVCNALISCAWEIATTKRRHHEDIPVYNYVSGNRNPITWGKLLSTVLMYIHIYPSNSSVYYPSLVLTKSMRLFNILHFFLNFIPALIIYHVTRLFAKEVGFGRITERIKDTLSVLRYFNCQQWDFEDHRIQSLWSRIGPHDKLLFPFGIQNLDWEEQSMKLVRGLWKYTVKDSDEDEKQAKRRHLFQYIVHVIILLTLGISSLWIVCRLCGGRSLTAPACVTHSGAVKAKLRRRARGVSRVDRSDNGCQLFELQLPGTKLYDKLLLVIVP